MAPRNSHTICRVFGQYPSGYRDARAAHKRWGIPVNVLMAFVQRESGFNHKARPKRLRFLFIPLPRRSSALGYAQAQDPIWKEYRQANRGWFKSRKDMGDSLDFIGWYTDRIHRGLGISKWDPKHLYIACHALNGWLNPAPAAYADQQAGHERTQAEQAQCAGLGDSYRLRHQQAAHAVLARAIDAHARGDVPQNIGSGVSADEPRIEARANRVTGSRSAVVPEEKASQVACSIE